MRMKNVSEAGYNERLFAGGLRARLHLARFQWLREVLIDLNCSYRSVVELGCFDGKLIDLLPEPPEIYMGFDANWEGGLDIAKQRWKGNAERIFKECSRPEDMVIPGGLTFDIAVAMETLEHLHLEVLDGYLQRIVACTRRFVFVTVPNEIGPFLLAKWLVKRFLSRDADYYTCAELANATIGRMHKVARKEHKGFDYRRLITHLDTYMEIIRVTGIPFAWLPPSMNFGVGIVGKIRS